MYKVRVGVSVQATAVAARKRVHTDPAPTTADPQKFKRPRHGHSQLLSPDILPDILLGQPAVALQPSQRPCSPKPDPSVPPASPLRAARMPMQLPSGVISDHQPGGCTQSQASAGPGASNQGQGIAASFSEHTTNRAEVQDGSPEDDQPSSSSRLQARGISLRAERSAQLSHAIAAKPLEVPGLAQVPEQASRDPASSAPSAPGACKPVRPPPTLQQLGLSDASAAKPLAVPGLAQLPDQANTGSALSAPSAPGACRTPKSPPTQQPLGLSDAEAAKQAAQPTSAQAAGMSSPEQLKAAMTQLSRASAEQILRSPISLSPPSPSSAPEGTASDTAAGTSGRHTSSNQYQASLEASRPPSPVRSPKSPPSRTMNPQQQPEQPDQLQMECIPPGLGPLASTSNPITTSAPCKTPPSAGSGAQQSKLQDDAPQCSMCDLNLTTSGSRQINASTSLEICSACANSLAKAGMVLTVPSASDYREGLAQLACALAEAADADQMSVAEQLQLLEDQQEPEVNKFCQHIQQKLRLVGPLAAAELQEKKTQVQVESAQASSTAAAAGAKQGDVQAGAGSTGLDVAVPEQQEQQQEDTADDTGRSSGGASAAAAGGSNKGSAEALQKSRGRADNVFQRIHVRCVQVHQRKQTVSSGWMKVVCTSRALAAAAAGKLSAEGLLQTVAPWLKHRSPPSALLDLQVLTLVFLAEDDKGLMVMGFAELYLVLPHAKFPGLCGAGTHTVLHYLETTGVAPEVKEKPMEGYLRRALSEGMLVSMASALKDLGAGTMYINPSPPSGSVLAYH